MKTAKRTAKGCTVTLATIQFDDDDATFVCENTDAVERELYKYVKENWNIADIDDPLPANKQDAIQQYLNLTNATLKVVEGLKVL